MSSQEILEQLRQKNKIITPNALKKLSEPDFKFSTDYLLNSTKFIIDEEDVKISAQIQKDIDEPKVIVNSTTKKYQAAEEDSQLIFNKESDISGKSHCTGTVEDFVAYFNNRLEKERKILKFQTSTADLLSISSITSIQSSSKSVRVIGMVLDKKLSKKGHYIITLEDEQSSLVCLISNSSVQSLKTAAENLVLDEIICFEGRFSKDLFIVNEINWPDIPIKEKKLIDSDLNIAFLSDLHVGSKFFMEDVFNQFLSFLKGEGEFNQYFDIASKIKYITIAGDLVDGVGIYPSQEKELIIKDIYKQYEAFCNIVKQFPEHISVIITPGNHDAVRGGQPQPRIPEEFVGDLKNYSNVHFLGSPSTFTMHGLKTLMYHGDSAFSLIGNVPSLTNAYSNPENIAIDWLKRRHLSPIYGDNPIIPEKSDYLCINEPPDILHFGHLHRNGYANYRGTNIINSGAWQSITDYQLKQGFIPTPAKLPIYNMKNGNFKILDFQ